MFIFDLLFQFQNGTIKRIALKYCQEPPHKFQFQNGTIKRADVLIELIETTSFQFQNGTIKREAKKLQQEVKTLFQFQNGTIKSNTATGQCSHSICFNSKMVRLKAIRLNLIGQQTIVSIPKWYD